MDGSGGAGALADHRTIMQNGGQPLLVQTALTAQNLNGVLSCWHTPASHIHRQCAALHDAPIAAIKIGVVHAPTAAIVGKCVRALQKKLQASANKTQTSLSQKPNNQTSKQISKPPRANKANAANHFANPANISPPLPPLVWDPVLSPTMGKSFVGSDGIGKCVQHLAPLATVLTPNYGECMALAAAIRPRPKPANLQTAMNILLDSGVQYILATDIRKGAQVHLAMYRQINNRPTMTWQTQCRRHGGNFHGTGCVLSSALATRLAHGDSPEAAAAHAHRQTLSAIHQATPHPKLGRQWLLG